MKVSLLIKLNYGTDVTNHALTEKVDNFLTKFKFNNFKIYIRCKITLKYYFNPIPRNPVANLFYVGGGLT